jgi:hypothetical protein
MGGVSGTYGGKEKFVHVFGGEIGGGGGVFEDLGVD